VNPNCRAAIEPAWSFCPHCGGDNRPPTDREPVATCRHRFVKAGDHCVLCGQLTVAERERRFGGVWFLVILASVFLVLSLFLVVAYEPATRLPRGLDALVNVMAAMGTRRHRPTAIHTTHELAEWLGIWAGALVVLAGLKYAVASLLRRSRRQGWTAPWQQASRPGQRGWDEND
jgi:hypothetical protein